MKVVTALLLVLVPLVYGFWSPRSSEEHVPRYRSEYTVVLVIDGPRYSETFGDTACTLIPRMGRELVKEGTLFTQFMNEGVTHTTPGHTAITTGVYQRIRNGGQQLPKKPSFLQYYLKHTGADKSDAWLIASKGKLQVLANTKDRAWWNQYTPASWCGKNGNGADYVGDAATWQQVEKVFAQHAPKVSLINLLAVDANGHQGNWEGYKKALLACDTYAARLWNLIQSHPAMKNKTTLLITNDHGRHLDGHKDGFVSHGDHCMGCKHISLLALGPDIKKDTRLSSPAELIDIPATIAHLMGFPMPTGKGRVLHEMFVPYSARP